MPQPRQIIILRHGEKPGDPENSHDGTDLSTRGYERAGALAPYVPDQFGIPDFLFATQASKHSNRPIETITPLATKLGMKIHSDYADGEVSALADHLLKSDKYSNKVILICWHHGEIPALTQQLGGTPPLEKWPGNVFDRVWVLNFGETGVQAPVKNIPQRLLYGDSSA